MTPMKWLKGICAGTAVCCAMALPPLRTVDAQETRLNVVPAVVRTTEQAEIPVQQVGWRRGVVVGPGIGVYGPRARVYVGPRYVAPRYYYPRRYYYGPGANYGYYNGYYNGYYQPYPAYGYQYTPYDTYW